MVGMLGLVSMSAPGLGGSQRAHGLEHIWALKVIVIYIFFVPASTATLTRTTLYLGFHEVTESKFLL